jgi:flagellar biosynthesis/type III secretory pathway protein FliH
MRSDILKRTLAVLAFGLMAWLGTAQLADAQTGKQDRRRQQEIERKDREAMRRQVQIEDSRIRTDQRTEQARIRSMRTNKVNSAANRYRFSRNGISYQTNERGAELLKQAVNAGYQEGYRSGRNDRYSRRASSYSISPVYRKGNYGYQSYVDSAQYKYYFQQGFERGYDDGFNTRYENGNNNNGSINILGTILQNILTLEQF